ncbi:hypothetical protein [Streptomyces sp. TE5632]
MRLLLRSNAHRTVHEGCREVAASPDTPRRERWSWQVRLLTAGRPRSVDGPADGLGEGPEGRPAKAVRTVRSLAGDTAVEVMSDPGRISAEVVVVGADVPLELKRAAEEIVVLLASGRPVLVEDRHRLEDADAMVLEGDDPLAVTVAPLGITGAADGTASGAAGGEAFLAVVRLRTHDGGALGWVP